MIKSNGTVNPTIIVDFELGECETVIELYLDGDHVVDIPVEKFTDDQLMDLGYERVI